jgi:hypothetical protein
MGREREVEIDVKSWLRETGEREEERERDLLVRGERETEKS